MNPRLKLLAAAASFSAAAVALCWGVFSLLVRLQEVNSIHYETIVRPTPAPLTLMIAGAVIISIAWALLRPWRPQWESRLAAGDSMRRPALWLLLFPADRFPGIFSAILIVGFTAWRIGNMCRISLPGLTEKQGTFIAVSCWLILAMWGYHVQTSAYDSLYFIYGDWNQYAAHYQFLLSGKGSAGNWCIGAGHWNPLINLLMTGIFYLHCAPSTVFAINALCIASAIPLGYWLCRKCGLSVWFSLLPVLITVLNPVLSNQYLALFYGFHPIVFFIPVLFGFFIAREYGNSWVMGILLAASLLIQETICIFWFGYGIYLFCRNRKLAGGVLMVSMPLVFYLISQVIMPRVYSVENYAQMFHYAQLGETPLQILISPFTRPAVFWGTLFSRSTILFIFALLTPFFFGVVLDPLPLLAIVPVAVGVCLQNSEEFKSVMLWYGVEITAFSMILMIINWKNAQESRIGKWLNYGFAAENIRKCSIVATITVVLFCGILLAFIPGNKGPAGAILSRSSGKDLISFLTGSIPAGSRKVIATSRIRGQLQFTMPNHDIRSSIEPGDVIILDLHDSRIDQPEEVSALRRQIAADKRIHPVTYTVWENYTIVMFRVLEKPVPLPEQPWLRKVQEKEFERAGTELKLPGKICRLRAFYHNGRIVYRALLLEKYEDDIEFLLSHKYKDGSIKETVIRFGNGLFPAYSVQPGTMFEFAIPGKLPAEITVRMYTIK